MQHQIAEFFAHILVILLENGIGELKSLLYRQISQRIERLFTIPRAFFAQLVHDFQQMPETRECISVLISLSHME